MPKKKNLDLAAELGEDIDVTEEQAIEANTIVAPAPVAVAPVAPQALTMTVADLQALVQTAVQAAQSGNQQIADIVTQGIAQARKPIPEGTDASNPRISDRNPLGDRDHAMPGLKCEITLGLQDGKTQQIQRTYPFDADDLTAYEQIALNTIQPGAYTAKLYDGSPIKISIVPEHDAATDALKRLTIVVPQHVTQKGSEKRNMLPGPCDLVAQLTGHNYAQLSKDDLAWFMAEHRKKNYVAVREAVAA